MISLPGVIPAKISDAVFGDRTHAFLSDGLNEVVFNVLRDESDTDTNEVTQHAIESGSPVTDHVIGRPKSLTLNIVFSDEDILFVNVPTSQEDLFLFEPISERKQTLQGWNDNKDLLTYYSHDEDYEDVVIESISRNHTLEYGSGIGLTITLKQVNIVESAMVTTQNQALNKKGAEQSGASQSGLQSQAYTKFMTP
jgi:hypothetical protein